MIWPALSQLRRSDGMVQAGSPGQVAISRPRPAAITVSGSTVTALAPQSSRAFDPGTTGISVPKTGTRFGRILD